ncbi:ADP-ribosyltransferase, partial [Streptomonospora nanhaiensis]
SQAATAPQENPPATAPETQPAPPALTPQERVTTGARTFTSDREVRDFVGYWDGYSEFFDSGHNRALTHYTSSRGFPTYRHINDYLRTGDGAHPDVTQDITQLDALLAGRPVPEDIVVMRGMDLDHIGMDPSQMPHHAEGFTDHAYMSTSLYRLPGMAREKQAIMHLRVPAGTPALWMDGLGEPRNPERELLLGR